MNFLPQETMFQLNEDAHLLPSPSPDVLSPSSTPQDFHGLPTLMMRRSMSFSGVERCEDLPRGGVEDDMSDDGCALGEKKRRLNIEQVRALEKSFELGNKLDPDRKMQLARALGLQPRQIAIWFQNRRARWKTKQLERDYDILKKKFEAAKADNDSLKAQNHKLHSELMALKSGESIGIGVINLNKDNNEGSWSNGSENSIDVNLGTTTGTTSAADSPLYSHPMNKNNNSAAFPTSISPNLTQFLHQSSSRLDLQGNTKIEQDNTEGYCNMFNGIEEQHNFWPWPDQNQQNFQ